MFIHICLFALYLTQTALAQGLSPEGPKIGSIDGTQSLEVKTPGGHKMAKSGDALNSEDIVITGKKVTATVRYPDGSVLVLGQKTELEIKGSSQLAEQTMSFNTGSMRALIRKIARKPGKQLRFMIKTKAAVIGVRGTDFLISADSAATSSKVYTLEGGVEVAQTEAKMAAGETTPVKAGEFVQATPDKIEAPQKFNKEELFQELKNEQPALNFEPEKPKTEAAPPEVAAKPTESEVEPEKTKWGRFQLSGQTVDLPDHTKTGGLAASWNPTFPFWKFYLRSNLGVLLYPSGSKNAVGFVGGDFRALLGLNFLWIFFAEVGPSVQIWTKQGVAAGGGVNFGLEFHKPLFGILDRIFMGFTKLKLPSSILDDHSDSSHSPVGPPPSGPGSSGSDSSGLEVRMGLGFIF